MQKLRSLLELKDRQISQMQQDKLRSHQEILLRTQNYIKKRVEFQKQLIADDEEFLRQLDFEINQMMISSWPTANPTSYKVQMTTFSTSTADE